MRDKLPIHLSRRCGARTRNASQCRSPAMANGRRRMHGGPSPGAPKGNKNALKHGLYTAEAIARHQQLIASGHSITSSAIASTLGGIRGRVPSLDRQIEFVSLTIWLSSAACRE